MVGPSPQDVGYSRFKPIRHALREAACWWVHAVVVVVVVTVAVKWFDAVVLRER